MDLDEFLYNLHFDIDKVRPVNLKVDFDDAPLPYKLYQGLPVFPLPFASSQKLEYHSVEKNENITLKDLGNLFWYTFGLTKISQSFTPFGVSQSLRRYVPSGGALYPSELYAYLKIAELPSGIYHYDVAHHSLVLLREGNFDDYIHQSLGHRFNFHASFGMIFISTMFWKNFFKYNQFSYRLQGIDAGIAALQFIEVAKCQGYLPVVFYQFLDEAVNHLIGLSSDEESVYAIVGLTTYKNLCEALVDGISDKDKVIFADDLRHELTPLQHEHYEKSRKVKPYPVIKRMNKASMIHSTDLLCTTPFWQMGESQGLESQKALETKKISLPAVQNRNFDFAAACGNRYSPGLDFVFGQTNLQQVANLLYQTMASFTYYSDIDLNLNEELNEHDSVYKVRQLARLSLAVCLHNINGISDGSYLYRPEAHSLSLIQVGDHRFTLQKGMSMQNVNLFLTPMCFHIVGDSGHLTKQFGFRGYRIQQMEVGMLLQKLLLSASSLGLNGHALLGYDETIADEVYQLATTKKTCLVQVPVGHYKTWSRLEGGLSG